MRSPLFARALKIVRLRAPHPTLFDTPTHFYFDVTRQQLAEDTLYKSQHLALYTVIASS